MDLVLSIVCGIIILYAAIYGAMLAISLFAALLYPLVWIQKGVEKLLLRLRGTNRKHTRN